MNREDCWSDTFQLYGKNGLIATSLAGQNNLYTSLLWTWARIKPMRLKPISGHFFVLCLVAQSCLTLFDPMDCSPPGSSVHEDSPGKNTRVGCHALLQGIFPTQGSNPGLLHCRRILYCLSHQGSPWKVKVSQSTLTFCDPMFYTEHGILQARILGWVVYPFSSRSSQLRNRTGVSCIVGGVFTNWAIREVHAAKSLQLCLTLCYPRDGSPPGSPVPGVLQARTLEWVAISFSNAWKWKGKVKSLSRVQPSATPWTAAHQASPFMGFSRQEYWSGLPLP